MKRLLTTFAFALAALCISACDSRRQPLFTANPLGAGPVLLTMSAAQIPASHPGLYDAFTTDRTPAGETVLRFTLAGEPVMEARAYGDEIESIEIFGPGVGSTDGIAPGTDVKHLFENGGISQTDNDGRLVITLNGMTYRVSGLGEEGREKPGKARKSARRRRHPAHLGAGFQPRRQSDEHPDQLTARKRPSRRVGDTLRRHDAGAARQQPTPAPRSGTAAGQRDSGTARHRRNKATPVRTRRNGCGNPHPPPHPETLPAGAPFFTPFCTL